MFSQHQEADSWKRESFLSVPDPNLFLRVCGYTSHWQPLLLLSDTIIHDCLSTIIIIIKTYLSRYFSLFAIPIE